MVIQEDVINHHLLVQEKIPAMDALKEEAFFRWSHTFPQVYIDQFDLNYNRSNETA